MARRMLASFVGGLAVGVPQRVANLLASLASYRFLAKSFPKDTGCLKALLQSIRFYLFPANLGWLIIQVSKYGYRIN